MCLHKQCKYTFVIVFSHPKKIVLRCIEPFALNNSELMVHISKKVGLTLLSCPVTLGFCGLEINLMMTRINGERGWPQRTTC